jgi:uncharacterized protein YacL
MNIKTLSLFRISFVLLTTLAGWLAWYSNPTWQNYLIPCLVGGFTLGIGTIFLDVLAKKVSLKGLTSLMLGLGLGLIIAYMVTSSPFFDQGSPEILFLTKTALFSVCAYLGTVITMRNRDEFNLVIPYVRLVPNNVEIPLVVVDASALMDGRIVGICAARFMGAALVVPRFVLEEIQTLSTSTDLSRRNKGVKAMATFDKLKEMEHIDVRIDESKVHSKSIQQPVVSVAQSLKAHLLTLDYHITQEAEMNGVKCLNLVALTKAVQPELGVGDVFEVELVKQGREQTQAVGYLGDGSMVVVNDASGSIGKSIRAEVVSVLPSAGGKMIFAQVSGAGNVSNN